MRAGERHRESSVPLRPPRTRCGSGSRGPAARAPTSNFPGLRCARGGGRRRQPIGVRLSAPTPSRRGPVGCESSPQPHRRPPAGAQSSRGVSGRRRRARGSPPPPVGLSRNSGNLQTKETYGPAGVTSPATPGPTSRQGMGNRNGSMVSCTPLEGWATRGLFPTKP